MVALRLSIILVLVALGLSAVQGCAPAAPPAAAPAVVLPTAAPVAAPVVADAQIAVSNASAADKFLVDGAGKTLYIFLRDTKDTSNCYDSCAKLWPPLTTQGKPLAKGGVNTALLGTTQRKDGGTQVTYNGMPLYYYAADQKPGDIKGQDVNQVWFVIAPDGNPIKTALGAAPSATTPAPRDDYDSGYRY